MSQLDIELTGPERGQLSDALLKAFPTAPDIQRFFKLTFDWDTAHFTTGPLRDQVWGLIEKAESEGLIRRLIRHAEWDKPGNQELRKFIKAKNLNLPASIGSRKRLYELIRSSDVSMALLEEIRDRTVDESSFSWDWYRLSEEHRIIELLDVLADLSAAEDTSAPLLEFVARLSHQPECRAAESELRKWFDSTCRELKLSQARSEALWTRVAGNAPVEPLYLLIKLDLHGDDEYMLKAWLSDARAEDCEVVFGGDGKLYQLSRFDAQIQEVLSRVQRNYSRRLLAARDEITFEFFLPRRLLGRRLDLIPIEGGAQAPIPLGIKYGVVVRSLERIAPQTAPNIVYYWKHRWGAFRENPANPAPILIQTAEESGAADLTARLAHNRDFFLGLLLAPQVSARSLESDLLTTLVISTGMPIAIWLHEGMHLEPDLVVELKRLLEKTSELPSQLKLQRVNGIKNERHLGNRLALMWDDPERLPQEFREEVDLGAPSTHG